MKSILKNFAWHLFTGLLIIICGLFVYLFIIMLCGYLPYSDRPGPGWHKGMHINSEEIMFIVDFLLFLSIYVLAELIIVFIVFRVIRLIGYNRIVFGFFGGLVFFFFTGYVTLGIGWYIALDFSTVIAGGILGAIYGATIFPKFLK
jgi:hypothetical protein